MEPNDCFYSEFDVPGLNAELIKSKFNSYGVPIPNWIDKDIISGNGIIKTITSLKNFSTTYQNIFRQVNIYFSKHVHIFLFHSIKIICEVPFRLDIIAELTEMLLMGDDILPYLFWAILLTLYKYKCAYNVQLGMFLEFLKLKGLLSEFSYSKILPLFYNAIINENCVKYLLRPKSNWRNVNDRTKVKDEEDEEEEEEEEAEEEEEDDEVPEIDYQNDNIKRIKFEMENLKKGFKGNRYSIEMKKFSFLLKNSPNFSYQIYRKLSCLPCEKTVDSFGKPYLTEINLSLFDINEIEKLLSIQNIHFNEPIDCNCAVDAAVFNSVQGSEIVKEFPFLKGVVNEDMNYSSIFTIYIEPIDPRIPPFPVHVMIKNDGFADETIDACRNEIIKRLTSFNIHCIFTSTDGDHFFDHIHDKVFEEYKNLLESGEPFGEIVNVVKKHNSSDPWPISDPFHLLKNVRPNVLFKQIGLSIPEKYDPNELANIVQSVTFLTDKSSQGSMKDSYPLKLFGFDSFIKSYGQKQSNFLICSLFLFIDAIRNTKLNIETRKQYLHTAFLFANYYLHQIGYIKTIGTRICLIRLMNTILGIYICTEREAFNMAHIGTHPVECFYGSVRIGCNFYHTIFNIIHTISKTILCNKIMYEFGIQRRIRGRKNIGGAVVEKQNDQYGYFPFPPDKFFILYLKNLYNLPIDQKSIQKLEQWYQFLLQKHNSTDDCEIYIQGQLAGCNIMSRNILAASNKKAKEKKEKKSNNNNQPKPYKKKLILNICPSDISKIVCELLNNAINNFHFNSTLIIHKIFGFPLKKGEVIPRGSDNKYFLYDIIKEKFPNIVTLSVKNNGSDSNLNQSLQAKGLPLNAKHQFLVIHQPLRRLQTLPMQQQLGIQPIEMHQNLIVMQPPLMQPPNAIQQIPSSNQVLMQLPGTQPKQFGTYQIHKKRTRTPRQRQALTQPQAQSQLQMLQLTDKQ